MTNLSHVMTLANSVIGVSVLAMPFCFKQCGIVLSILMLLVSSILSKFACHFLVKSAVMSRRRNFEFLAFHAFGRAGKFLAELFIIGFLMGTCIAFFVVVGDLGPEIIGKMTDQTPADIRTSLLVLIGGFVILPLGLLRNVDSLSSICTATIGFYLCLVLKVMMESMAHIFATDWYDKVFLWRPSGILQCLPIFSMALFCQTQLFEIYEAIPNVSLDKMNRVVDVALNICTVVYVCVGFFGYIAFCNVPFTGNILMSFEPSLSSDAIKIGFVLSVAFSFPLVIFPCRASLHSLLFRWAHSHETASNYIPESQFKGLTFVIVGVSLITGILIPNIEFVLGLVGSTIGVMICLMFPAAFFISISSKNTSERLLAQTILFIGVWIMILGTYANLYAMEESANAKLTVITGDSIHQLNNIPIDMSNENSAQMLPPLPKLDTLPEIKADANFKPVLVNEINEREKVPKDDARQEPPIPVERAVVTEKIIAVTPNPKDLAPMIREIVEEINKLDKNKLENSSHKDELEPEIKKNDNDKEEPLIVLNADEKVKELEIEEKKIQNKNDILINSDAIKKEESELAAARVFDEREEWQKTLQQHEIEQQQMLQEVIEISNNIKQEREKERKEKLAGKTIGNKVLERENKDSDPINKPLDVAADNLSNKLVAKAEPMQVPNILTEDKLSEIVESRVKDVEINNEAVGEKVDMKTPENPGFLEVDQQQTMIKSRGPILSALVKKIPNSSHINDIPLHANLAQINSSNDLTKIDSNNNTYNINNNNISNKVPVPIALVMREKTKKGGSNEEAAKLGEDNIAAKPAVGRDILANAERKKREITDREMLDNYQESANTIALLALSRKGKLAEVDSINDRECSKTDKSLMEVDDKHETGELVAKKEKVTTEKLLIKTNSYLSDQSLIHQNTLESGLNFKTKFEDANQRDLKPVGSNNGNKFPNENFVESIDSVTNSL